MEEKKYPIGGFSPGNYQCKCATCGEAFHGDKRAVQCELCALEAKARFDALDPNDKELLIKRNARIANYMFSGPLSAERDLIYRIVEEWGNAIEMPNMEQWLKDYALRRGCAVLPANDAVQNWFEENIDKECSASSAVFKFRQWLESLQVTRQAEAVLPEPTSDSVRYELRLALYDMIRVTRGVIENRGTILSARKRIEAAEGILNKHFKITDVLRGESPAADWAKDYDTLYYIVMPVLNKLRHRTDNDTRMMERGSDIRDTIHKALADIKKLPPPISSNEPPFLVQSDATPAAAREEEDPQEIWDEFSEYIGNDIDDCQNVAGSFIMTETSFKKAFAKFKQQKNP